MGELTRRGQGPAHDRLHRRRRARDGRCATARARPSSTRSTWRTARSASRRSSRCCARYGGAVVVGCIDEDKQQGMAVTRAAQARHRRALAPAAHRASTGFPPRDLIFDAAGLPGRAPATPTTSARRWRRSRALRAIKARFPECQDHSRHLQRLVRAARRRPRGAQRASSSIHCAKAGLDYAIVNTERLERYASIPEEERRLAEDLIYCDAARIRWRAFAAHFRERTKTPPATQHAVRSMSGCARYIVEGSRDGLIEDLDAQAERRRAARHHQRPAHDAAWTRSGRLFNDNQLIVAEVLQSRRGDEGGRGAPRAVHGEGRGRPRAARSCWPP